MFKRKFLATSTQVDGQEFVLATSAKEVNTREEFAKIILEMLNSAGGKGSCPDTSSITIYAIADAYTVALEDTEPPSGMFAIPQTESTQVPFLGSKLCLGKQVTKPLEVPQYTQPGQGSNMLGLGMVGLAGYVLGKSLFNGTNRRFPN